MNWKYIWHTIPFLIMGTLIATLFCSNCGGMLAGLTKMALVILYTILLLTQLGYSLYKYFYRKRKFNYLPLIISIILILYIFLNLRIKNNYTSGKILIKASNYHHHKPFIHGRLFLFENNQYAVKLLYNIENDCMYYGDFSISNDTLKLNTKIKKQSQSYINSNILIIDTVKGYLIPINKKNDTTYWFQIESKSN